MPASQQNPLALDPNALDLQQVATYTRQINANLARVWENVLDWEHLPHLHDASFSYCELDEAGRWGWRVWSDPAHEGHIELCVDEGCYVARSYSRGEQFSEIWTHLKPQGDCTDIRVEFYSSGVTEDNRDSIGEMYLGLYQTLWDEDEAMMSERQLRLEQNRSDASHVILGDVQVLRQKLPMRFELNRREYELSETIPGWTATPTVCPHLLGPLAPSDEPGQLRCPWHGYVFDLASGACVSPPDARCSIGLPLDIQEQDGQLIARTR
jgi:nitrite reductase/ring-hydroxylating ferredoxin subunit